MPETSAKHPLEDDYKQEMKRRIEAEAKLEEATKEKVRVQNELSNLRRKQGVTVESKALEEKKVEHAALEIAPGENMNDKATSEVKNEHTVRYYEKFCPDCGADNPDWKDEIECKGCGTALGAASNAPKISRCPNGRCEFAKVDPARPMLVKLRKGIDPKAIDLTGVKVIA